MIVPRSASYDPIRLSQRDLLSLMALDGVGRDSNAATEPQIEADGAVAPDKIAEALAFGQAVERQIIHGEVVSG